MGKLKLNGKIKQNLRNKTELEKNKPNLISLEDLIFSLFLFLFDLKEDYGLNGYNGPLSG